VGLISLIFKDLDTNCVMGGSRFYRGRPALGYLSGVRPQLDAEVTKARDVILAGALLDADLVAPGPRLRALDAVTSQE